MEQRCMVCGCFLEVRGGWVGESHWDDELYMSCNNPRCKTNQREPENKGLPDIELEGE